jgi:alkylhydroperoxidase family enzyme
LTEIDTTGTSSNNTSNGRHLAGVPLIDIEELDPQVRRRLQAKIDRLGYLGDFFQLTAHQPEALAAFIDYTDATKKALPDDLAEVVALTVATLTGNDYERHQHERLSIKLGLPRDWVQTIERLNPESTALTREQRATQRWVLAVLPDHGHGSESEVDELVRTLGPRDAIAVALMCGRYVAHATIANSFGIQPPVASIFSEPITP